MRQFTDSPGSDLGHDPAMIRSPQLWRWLAGLVIAGAFMLLPVPGFGLEFPQLSGRVVDQAGLLTAADRAQLTADLAALEDASSDQLVVVTLRSLQGVTIEDFGYQLGRHWGIGQAGKDNGILLIVAPTERKVRIEVGRGLEGVVTDALASLVINNAILPRFRRGDFSGGVMAGAHDIRDIMLGDAEAVKQRAVGKLRTRDDSSDVLIDLLIWLVILIFILYIAHQNAKLNKSGSGHLRRDGSAVIIPGDSSDAGSWSGGWSGGGGFGGGGGGFGGGGSSGGW